MARLSDYLFFRGRTPVSIQVTGDRIEKYIADQLANVNLLSGEQQNATEAADEKVWANEEFWNLILNSPTNFSRWFQLSKFQIVDWFPRTPGRFHTKAAEFSRREAQRYLRREDGIDFFLPDGKVHMIDGGIGAVRFKPIIIDGSEYWLCTATTDGHCHSGIPIAVPQHLVRILDSTLLYNIVGKTRFLPSFMEPHFIHQVDIPQLYIQVDKIEPVAKGHFEPVIISPIIFFGGREEEYRSYACYVNCYSNSNQELDSAVDWMEEYSERFGSGKIITNFDQQRPKFKDAPFSLQNVMTASIQSEEIQKYGIGQEKVIVSKMKMTVNNYITNYKMKENNKIKIGKNSKIKGNVVLAKKVENSFNTLKENGVQKEVLDLLKLLGEDLTTIMEKLPEKEAAAVAKDYQTMVDEIATKKPRKAWIDLCIGGLKTAATAVGALGKTAIENMDKLMPLIDKMT